MEEIQQLIEAWQNYDPNGSGIVFSEMVRRFRSAEWDELPDDHPARAMQSAIESFVGILPGKELSARIVGNRMKAIRRRVIAGKFVDSDPKERARGGAVWRLHSVKTAS